MFKSVFKPLYSFVRQCFLEPFVYVNCIVFDTIMIVYIYI